MSREDDRATQVFADYCARLDRGEAVDLEEVVRAHPEIADDLRRRFAVARRLDRAFGRVPAAEFGCAGGSQGAIDETAARGALEAPTPPSLAGRLLGPYRLDAELGAGGMGTVYSATVEGRAPSIDRGTRVAVKVIHPHLLAREGFFKRFLREVEMGRRLVHGNVVRTLDADAVSAIGGHVHFLVMEHVEGQTLRGLLEELGRVPEELCRHIGREVARALSAIHAAGVIHRDIKPENVLITRDHVVKVMDLGVAGLLDDAFRLSQTGAFVGSVRYAAPEQFRARSTKLDGRADLYALGLTLYELATGRHPFDGDDLHDVLLRQMTATPRPAGELNPQLSALFEAFLSQLLEKDREQRFGSAADVLGALEQGDRSTWWQTRAPEIRAATRRPLRRVRIPRETALYGRETELAQLTSVFTRAAEGDGQVVLIEGEAGIGKSRLVSDFVELLHQQGHEIAFLFGSYPPGGAATASGAFSTAYREQFGDADLDVALRTVLSATPLLAPGFAALLRGDVTPTGAEPLTKDSLQTVFVHATRHLAAERPTIVLIDDLHFAPDEGRALFAALALAVPGHRVLLVGTARPGLPEAWSAAIARLPHATRLPLHRLGAKHLARLLVDAFRSERLAEELSFRIAEKSDGNPYFVFEILRELRDGQFIAQSPDGTWSTTGVIRDIRIPSTVRDLIAARTADLDAEDKDLLDVASCVGFEFDAGLAADALGVPHVPALKRLARIETRHRLVRCAGERFVFDHHQVHETIRDALPPPLARAYHAAIAVALEARTGAASKDPADLDGSLCVDLAEHFLRGSDGPRAARYLDRALTCLEGRYLHDAAERLAATALALPGCWIGRERVDLLLRRARRLDIIGRREVQGEVLDEAVRIADATGDASLRARSQMGLGTYFSDIARRVEAESRLRAAVELARGAGDRLIESHAIGNLGNLCWTLGRYDEALTHHTRQIELARDLGDRLGESRATGNLGLVLGALGRREEAYVQEERHLALTRELGDRLGALRATGNRAVALQALGRFDEAQRRYEQHLALSREFGYRRGEAMATGNLGSLAHVLGRLADARRFGEQYLALAREIGDRRGEGIALANLGSVAVTLGDFAEARRRLAVLLVHAREVQYPAQEAIALRLLAEVASEEGDSAEALRIGGEAVAKHRSVGHLDAVAAGLVARARDLAIAGDPDGARVALAEALGIADRLSLPGVVVVARARQSVLDPAELPAAFAALASHGDRLDHDGATEARFLLWRASGDLVHLVEAKRCVDHVVAHAPPECRRPMLANVRLLREIAAAAREHLPG